MSILKKFLFLANNFINSDFFKLIIILLIALFLRTFRLSFSPPRLTHDEMSIGYNAYSILKTGKDEWGRSFPLDFEAFGDHKLPGYIYSLVPFLSFLPMSMVSIKIPSIIAGLSTILAMFYLTKTITKNRHLSFLTAFLLAISPWPIHISRMALESNLALALFSWGIYFLIKTFDLNSVKDASKNLVKDNRAAILAGLFLAFSTYFYIAYRLIVILVLFLTLVLTFKYKLSKKRLLALFSVFILVLLPLIGQLFGKSGTARFTQVSIFSNDGVEATILEQHNFCFLSQPKFLPRICRVIYNKPFFYIKTFSKNYLSFLLPTFLFIEGDQLEYLNDPSFAEFYMFLIPFYLMGINYWVKKKGYKADIIKYSFLIAPIPSALVGDPQIVRGSALLLFVTLFSATGIYEVFRLIKKKFYKYSFVVFTLLLTLISLVRFFISYSYIYPGKYENSFYQLSDKIALFMLEKESDYDLIYIDKNFPDAHILISFYNQIDPSWYQDNIVRPVSQDGFGFSHPTKLGKYEFGDELLDGFICNEEDDKKVLYVSNHLEIPADWVFKDFSNVHTQVQVYDIDQTRDKLKKAKLFRNICH
ncbi:MAG: phospholipid carrier-dependent glycosyltransferase [Candidatus Pacebacteria bacterium]|jgi:hypothetical protein|nr:phospholipid carrier-dependent glycosyltransferase [Candidatus Paceibacterota bacterium]MBT6756025.1 phospholipid carrier-dependent glycosyltransferase [Candidatus Paceibacterota bacterium]MBT6920787.1 phospholipid carrier-dependent glycosyltransferase [Candidatus Paceibacterota bacterium]